MGRGVAERHTPARLAKSGEASGQGLRAKLFGGYPAASAGGSQNPKGSGPCARQGRRPLVRLLLYWAYYELPDGSQNGYQMVTKRFPKGSQEVTKTARFSAQKTVHREAMYMVSCSSVTSSVVDAP